MNNSRENVVHIDFKEQRERRQWTFIENCRRVEFLSYEIEKLLWEYMWIMRSFFDRKVDIISKDPSFSEEKYWEYLQSILSRSRSISVDFAYTKWVYLVEWKTVWGKYTKEELELYLQLVNLRKDFLNSISFCVSLFERIKNDILEISDLNENLNLDIKINRDFIKRLPYLFFTSLEWLTLEKLEKLIQTFYSLHFTESK